MSKGFAITITVPDGHPDGVRIIEKSNWNGRGIDFPRSAWTTVRSRPDFTKPGIYVLSGPPDDVYVGEADSLKDRLNTHYASLDFWTRGVAFVSQGANLNKTIVKYLEAKMLELARAAKRSTIKNTNKPSMPYMSEPVQIEADGFLDEMLPICPILGIGAFEIPPSSTAASGAPRLRIQAVGVVAYGRDEPEGFVIDAGSTIRPTEVKSVPSYVHETREKLRSSGVLVKSGSVLAMTEPAVFSSPSNAAGFVLGRAANGRTEWVDDSGRTLKDIQEAAAKHT